jgi:hypothetical protein
MLKLSDLIATAKNAGFEVREYQDHAELWYPNNTKDHAVWHEGSCYSTSDIVLSCIPGIGYGYNSAFYGPWHKGYVQADSFGVEKLFAYLNGGSQ